MIKECIMTPRYELFQLDVFTVIFVKSTKSYNKILKNNMNICRIFVFILQIN